MKQDYNTATFPHEKYYDVERYELKEYQKKQKELVRKAARKASKTLDLKDEEMLLRERQEARGKKEKEEFQVNSFNGNSKKISSVYAEMNHL